MQYSPYEMISIFSESIFLDGNNKDYTSLSFVNDILNKIKYGETYFSMPDDVNNEDKTRYYDVLNFLSSPLINVLNKVFINRFSNRIISYDELLDMTERLTKNNINLKNIELYFILNKNAKIYYLNKWIPLEFNNNNNKNKGLYERVPFMYKK